MNVIRYISLFLLKNRSCYIEGIGTLVVEQRSAYHDGESLHATRQEVVLNNSNKPDELANFIAVNEQVSLSKVFSALHGFAAWLKNELDAGREVPVPHIGKFAQTNSKPYFITDEGFKQDLPSFTAARSSVVTTESNEPEALAQPKKRTGLSGTLVILLLIILIFLGMHLYNGYKELQAISDYTHGFALTANTPADIQQAPATAPVDTVAKDTTTINNISTNMPATAGAKPGIRKYDVVLASYYTLDKAQTTLQSVESRGNHARIVTKDSLKFLIVMTVRTTNHDTTKVLDSMAALFNPKGVYIR